MLLDILFFYLHPSNVTTLKAAYKCFIGGHDSPFSPSYNLLYQAVFSQTLFLAANNLKPNKNDIPGT